jgi:glutamate--cysteine ligase
MSNEEKIAEYISLGSNSRHRIGLELEHFVCDEEYRVIPYEKLAECLEEISIQIGGTLYREEGHIFGVEADEYNLSLEPGCQLEISISPKERAEEIEQIYRGFRRQCEPVLAKRGYALLEKGVFPLVENGTMEPEELPLIPKQRYRLMDKYFEHTGSYGRYMMRATASTQVSLDFSSEQDALQKMRILEKLSPILALITENKNGIGTAERWGEHLVRSQIWSDLDQDRCGYPQGSLSPDYSFLDYAHYVYTKPCILLKEGGKVTDLGGKSAADHYGEQEITAIDHVLSMFFPHVRLKKYVEYRVADSMPIHRAAAYAAFLQGLVYDEDKREKLDSLLAEVTHTEDILAAQQAVVESGYGAIVYGRPVMDWIRELFQLALSGSSPKDRKMIEGLLSLPVLNEEYRSLIRGREKEHGKEAEKIREYLLQSTAKYHNRVVRTLYVPKLFTPRETMQFSQAVTTLYGIFDKVIREFETNPDYRSLFGFPEELNALILRPKKYHTNIPIARVDIFYNEETGDFKFCEFNTDGTSAMNEDRELNTAFGLSLAYQQFAAQYPVDSYELFDTWVEEAISLYREFSGEGEALPSVAIVDFMENATVNEFLIFEERFKQRGCRAQVCDIRQLVWDGEHCRTPEGMTVDVIYRRAVTSDILHHFQEVDAFLAAVKSEKVCLLGDFRTQIVHNKILYKILHLEETMKLLDTKEKVFVQAHVPLTLSLDHQTMESRKGLLEKVYEHKDGWIIKPEDSYGSHGVHAGVESENDEEWKKLVDECMDQHYILQEFVRPYRLSNIDLLTEDPQWTTTSNLTGLFVYNGKFSGIYSRISFDEMISTQYNEMSLPTMIVTPGADEEHH